MPRPRWRRIKTRYGTTDDGHVVAMPSYDMYLFPPPDALCIISQARSGTKRGLPLPLPKRETCLWDKEMIWLHTFALQRQHSVQVCSVRRRQCWEDLWLYYDSEALWYSGPWNLWNLLNHLAALNEDWDRGIRDVLAPFWNWQLPDSEAKFDTAVFKLRLAVHRDSYHAFSDGTCCDKDGKKIWPDGKLWWFDWVTNLRDLFTGKLVGEPMRLWTQPKTDEEGRVVDNCLDGEDFGGNLNGGGDNQDNNDQRPAEEEHMWPWDIADVVPDDNLDTTNSVETCVHIISEDVRVLYHLTTEWARSWIGRVGNKRRLCGWRRAFDILSVLCDDDWEVDFGGRRQASADLRCLVRMELERLYHDHYPFDDDDARSALTHGKNKEVKGRGGGSRGG